MKLTVPACMSVNAGYVDTAGFLALQGLFTAHVTGNFVTLGAALFARCPYGAAFGCPSTIAAANATSREEPALPPAAFPVDAELVERWRVARILGLLTGP